MSIDMTIDWNDPTARRRAAPLQRIARRVPAALDRQRCWRGAVLQRRTRPVALALRSNAGRVSQ
jgi:hypothetical protein